MADAIFEAIESHSTTGVFKVSIHYDDASLLITSADVLNMTGDAHYIVVGSTRFEVPNGTNANIPLSNRNQFMVNSDRGPRPPLFIG